MNLVHVCSRWQEGFSQAGEQPFYAQPERSKMVAMMSKAGDFPYARDTAFSCLRLFYDCHAVDMALFLPTLRAGLHEMLPALGCWKDVRAALDRTAWTSEVTVTLPKVRHLPFRECVYDYVRKRASPFPNDQYPGAYRDTLR